MAEGIPIKKADVPSSDMAKISARNLLKVCFLNMLIVPPFVVLRDIEPFYFLDRRCFRVITTNPLLWSVAMTSYFSIYYPFADTVIPYAILYHVKCRIAIDFVEKADITSMVSSSQS